MKNQKRKQQQIPDWIEGWREGKFCLAVVLVVAFEYLTPSFMVMATYARIWPWNILVTLLVFGRLLFEAIGFNYLIHQITLALGRRWVRRQWLAITGHQFYPGGLENDLYGCAQRVSVDKSEEYRETLNQFWVLWEGAALVLGYRPRHVAFADYLPQKR